MMTLLDSMSKIRISIPGLSRRYLYPVCKKKTFHWVFKEEAHIELDNQLTLIKVHGPCWTY